MKPLAFGLGVGAAIQAFKNWPADGPVNQNSAIAVFVVGLVAAYMGGRARRGSSASAVAVASSEATATASNQVNVAVVVPGGGASSSSTPTASMPWLEARPVVELDQLDGMAVEDLMTVAERDSDPEGIES